MYSYIKGTLAEIAEGYIVIDNHGIGYQIQTSANSIDELPPLGAEVKIYTYLHVKEDGMALFSAVVKGKWNRPKRRAWDISGVISRGTAFRRPCRRCKSNFKSAGNRCKISPEDYFRTQRQAKHRRSVYRNANRAKISSRKGRFRPK